MEDRMQRRLEGKVAVITGTGDGMGRSAALRFCAEGARVVGCDINDETAAETLRLVREAGGEMECLYPLDLSDEAGRHRHPVQQRLCAETWCARAHDAGGLQLHDHKYADDQLAGEQACDPASAPARRRINHLHFIRIRAELRVGVS